MPPLSDTASQRVSPRRPRWRARLAALALGLLVFWGIPELVTRWLNPPLPAFRAITFGDPETSPRLFVQDRHLGWALRPNVDVRFMGRRVRTGALGFRGADVPRGTPVILCLGDSTTFGWGVGQSETFAAQLEHRMAGRYRVINAGVPAYSSAQLCVLAGRLIPLWKPRWVVVCTGNNEAWPVERSDRSIYIDRNPVATAIADALASSRFLSWMVQVLAPSKPKTYRAPPARLAVPRVARDETSDNLAAIARLTEAHAGHLIVVSPTVNLFHPPIERELLRFADSVDHRAAPDEPPSPAALAELDRWRLELAQVNKLLDAKRYEDALGAICGLQAAHPHDFRYVWLEGVALSAGGRRAEGTAKLEAAFQALPFPDRCNATYRNAIEETAARLGAVYIDANALFERDAGSNLPLGYYLDWCHPTARGHALVAEAILKEMQG